jgi:hypothetical protein
MYLAAFHHHAAQAQWHTLNSVLRIAGQRVDGVVSEAIAVAEWWRTIESLISLLLLVAARESDLGVRGEQAVLVGSHKDDVVKRWSAIAGWFSDRSDSAPKRTTSLLKELRDFRNSIEHASRHSTIKIEHSRLGTLPAGANLADAMEGMAICVLACDFLRFILPTFDIMPQVVAPSRRHVFYVGLDVLASEIAFPAYAQLVRELGMTTDIAPYTTGRHLRGEARLAAALVVKAQPDANDLAVVNPVDLWPGFEAFTESRPVIPSEAEFGIPRYTRDR